MNNLKNLNKSSNYVSLEVNKSHDWHLFRGLLNKRLENFIYIFKLGKNR